jgi:transposase InsO family protein
VSFINNNLKKYTVKQMCKALKFARSTYYEALVHVPSNREQEYLKFSAEVKQCFEENKKRYGAVKIHHKLNDNGVPCSIKRVQRHMQRQGLHSVVVKKYNHKANQGKVPDDKENVLNRDFKAETINKKWVTDITYIHVLKEGWTYLASVMDLYDRKIIGYAYGKNMTAELALDAVKNASLNVSDTNGIILHSDLGSQYTSDLFENYMKSNGFIHSFSRKGNPYDNACIESFHSVMKKEEIYLHIYKDFEECRKALFEYIESWYNRQRIHSALGYKTPQQMEDEAIQVA